MAQNFVTTFSIEADINPETDRPFGNRYAGEFTIRRPSLADRIRIAVKDAASFSALGTAPLQSLSKDVVNLNFVFCHLDILADSRPAWCYPDKLWADFEDEIAVYFVWQKMDAFFQSFRAPASLPTDQKGQLK